MKIHKSNLITALSLAITEQRKFETEKMNYTRDSGLVAGWQEVLDALKNDEEVEVV